MPYSVSRLVRVSARALVLAAAVALLSVAPASAVTPPPAGAVVKLGAIDGMSNSSYGWGNWASPDAAYYYVDASGDLGIVRQGSEAVTVDTFDLSTMKRIGTTRTVSLAGWPDWGGFYAGADGCLYVLVGRRNYSEVDTLDVVAVRRYDRDWNLLGTAYVQGGVSQGVKGIVSPFEASAAHMVLVGNRLVVHMGRLIYAIAGIHHQVNLTFEVNVDTMTATAFGQLGGYAYCSHSFQQLVAMNGTSLVTIDHGDAYPRAIQMGVMPGYPAQRDVSTYDLFAFNGAIGDNFTGATVNGLASGPQGVVVLGTSIPQPNAPTGALGSADERHNVFAIWADPVTGAHTLRWLTQFAPSGTDTALEPRVAQVGPDRFAVMFSVETGTRYRMEYRLIDSAGTVCASASFPGVLFCAAADPIVLGHIVYWTGAGPDGEFSPATCYLFGLDVSDPAAPTLLSSSVDFMAPCTSSSAVAYYANAATVRLTATDLGGSGVAHTFFTMDGGAQVESTTVTVSRAGTHTLRYWSSDAAGNVEQTNTVTFTIVTPPSANGTPSTPSTSTSVSSIVHGRSYAFFGYVTRHTSGTYPVTLQFYRYVSGRWVYFKSTSGKASTALTFSRYLSSTSVPYAGKWRVRARHYVSGRYRYSGWKSFTAN